MTLTQLAPGRCGCYLKKVIFKLISRINILSILCEIVLSWMPQDLTDDKSTLVQVMAWCRQATSHYLSQCWPRCLSPYGITRPQGVNTLDVIKSRPVHAYMSGNWVIMDSGEGLTPVQCQYISWTNAGLLSIGPLSKLMLIQIQVTIVMSLCKKDVTPNAKALEFRLSCTNPVIWHH